MGVRNSIQTPPLRGAQEGDLLVVGWGSTYGAIADAVERVTADGKRVGHLHLRHVWPLPKDLEQVFDRFKAILVPEINLGQMARILRSEYTGHAFHSFPKVQGQPFRASEIVEKINGLLEN